MALHCHKNTLQIETMGFLDFIFGAKKRQLDNFVKEGAIFLDVRTQREFANASIAESKHIPLQDLHNHVDELKALGKPFIVYCESGVRSAKAAKYLNMNNIAAINGGGWLSLSKRYNKPLN